MNIRKFKQIIIIYIILSFIFPPVYAREKTYFKHVSIYGSNHPISFLQTDSIIKLRIMPPHLQNIICKIQKQKNIIECPRTLFYTDYIYFSDPDMNAIAFNLYMTYLFLDKNDRIHALALCNKIEKRGIIIKGNHGGLRVSHNARIRDTYVPIEESWLAEFQKRFPDYELPTSDIAPYSQFGAVIFFSCFETNLSDEDIWTIVEIIINDDDSDRELLYTKMREKAAEENNRLFVLENL